MHKHTSQLRGANNSSTIRGPVRRWNSFHGGGVGNFGDGIANVGNGGTIMTIAGGNNKISAQEPFRAVPKAVQALRSESVDRTHRAQPPPPPAFPRRRFSVCFGKRTGGSARRPNECFVLEPSEMIVIDYPEVHSGGRMHRPPHPHPITDHRQVNLVFDDT